VNFSYEACTGIGEHSGQPEITIYPNPGSGIITIEGKGVRKNMDITLFNITGTQVSAYLLPENPSGISSVKADLSALPRGIYILKIKSDKLLKTNKLVLE
jgi:UDP-3-O-acyl-N-acetylglucosamine deacetylase